MEIRIRITMKENIIIIHKLLKENKEFNHLGEHLNYRVNLR